MYSSERPRFEWKFYVLPVIVGALAGIGAIIFRYLIAIVYNLFFEGKFNYFFDDHLPLSTVWGNYVILIPVIGFFLVGVLVNKGAPEAKGHGVPEVMTAVFTNKGNIRPRVAGIKTIASALCIGTGGSTGREGPIVQIGASIGSAIGQLLHLSSFGTITLLGCGAAAGIAATFNAPLGGILFAIELILPEFSVRTFVPLALSASTSTYLVRWCLGNEPAFSVPHYVLNSGYELPLYAVMGLLIGVIAVFYIKSLYKLEDLFEDWNVSPYFKPVVGGIVVGVTGLILFKSYGNFFIFGVGYSTISDVISGVSGFSIVFLLALVVLKVFATSMTLGSGGSGGIFAPGLFIGACFGAAFGLLATTLFPTIATTPSAYASVGMGAFIGGITGAPFMAIVMFFEMTRDYSIILPLTISVVIARAFVHYHSEGTVYEIKLLKNNIKVPHERAIDMLSMTPIKEIMDAYMGEDDLLTIYLYSSALDALVFMDEHHVNELAVIDSTKKPVGVVRKDDIVYFYTRERINYKK